MDRRDFISATTKAVAAVTLGYGNCVDDFLEPRRSYFFISKTTQLYPPDIHYLQMILDEHWSHLLNSFQPRGAFKWYANPWTVSRASPTPSKTAVLHGRSVTMTMVDEIHGAGAPIEWNPSRKVGPQIYGASLLDAVVSTQRQWK